MKYLLTLTLFLIAFLAGCATEPEEVATRLPDRATPTTPLPDLDEPLPRAATELAAERREGQAPSSGIALQKQPAHSSAPVADAIRQAREPLYRERYRHPGDNRVIRVTEQPVSTFSIDVDTGAYSNARRWLEQGRLPPENAVRVEEFINYFDYAYTTPRTTDEPFAIDMEIAPAPWNSRTRLLRVGIQGYDVPGERLPPANLVFLVDVSGSMQSADKLPLLRNALTLLVQELDADDHISLVVYAGAAGVVLPPTPGHLKSRIIGALQGLEAGGSTNGAAGIELAYRMAREHFTPGGVNRVILATDGDFNVGLSSTDELIDLVQRQRASGIALTTLGFGGGNYNDHLMEQLADEGNGHYAYIDRLSEARKVLSSELSSTLLTIAGDVKIQLEFNPAVVTEYRLIGYENRLLAEEDFANDRVDAGEIGAGHRVTALYEISLSDSEHQRLQPRRYATDRDRRPHATPLAGELAFLRIRYKRPGESHSRLLERPVLTREVRASLAETGADFRFAAAVAAFGQKLRGGRYLENWRWEDIASLAAGARGADTFGYRGEFLQLVGLASALSGPDRVAHAAEP